MASFFTELFRIDSSQVKSLLDPELERDSKTSLFLRHLGDLELVGLWESLQNAHANGTLMEDLLSDPEDEQLVFSLPSEFLEAIESVSDVDTIAKKWSQMDELADWKISDLAKVICDIRSLVRDAKANNQIVVQLAEI